jgi:glucose-1-phosphate cytidylyltransferase
VTVKTIILAGGLGTRLAEETDIRPKPMVEIGGKPILWHILKHYACYGLKEFYIALGYKGEVIKRYFLDFYSHNAGLKIDFRPGRMMIDESEREDWIVHLIQTGLNTATGGRLKRLESWLEGDTFMVTYGDGVSDIDLNELLRFHRTHGRIATVTAVRPPARFGGLVIEEDLVTSFTEKPLTGEGWINGGFMIFEPAIFNLIKGDETILEKDVLERLAQDRQLAAYRHNGFWQCMDTIRDKQYLEGLWQGGLAPWRIWQDRISGAGESAPPPDRKVVFNLPDWGRK